MYCCPATFSGRPGLVVGVVEVEVGLAATNNNLISHIFSSSQPDKFGIKFWLAADLETKYLLNGMPYLGKEETRPRPRDQTLGEHVVLSLLEPYMGKGRNVTTDNFFTSMKLANALLQKKTTLVGTIRKNKRELPPAPKKGEKDGMEHLDTILYKHGQATLTKYKCKVDREPVQILITQHQQVKVSLAHPKKKPETVLYYNTTKVGVDILDQMARAYSVKGIYCYCCLLLLLLLLLL